MSNSLQMEEKRFIDFGNIWIYLESAGSIVTCRFETVGGGSGGLHGIGFLRYFIAYWLGYPALPGVILILLAF